jgi:hypothetical protein
MSGGPREPVRYQRDAVSRCLTLDAAALPTRWADWRRPRLPEARAIDPFLAPQPRVTHDCFCGMKGVGADRHSDLAKSVGSRCWSARILKSDNFRVAGLTCNLHHSRTLRNPRLLRRCNSTAGLTQDLVRRKDALVL